MGQWSTNRCANWQAPWIPILMAVAVAWAQEAPAPRTEPLQQPVIRAWELPLKDVTTVAAVRGVVRITRNGAIVIPSVGDSIEPQDLVQITTNSSLTLKSVRGTVTLTHRDGEWFKFVR